MRLVFQLPLDLAWAAAIAQRWLVEQWREVRNPDEWIVRLINQQLTEVAAWDELELIRDRLPRRDNFAEVATRRQFPVGGGGADHGTYRRS